MPLPPSASPAPRPARYAGLDGLRAIAVSAVIVYHLFPAGVLPGGFLGVDVFFVISGFLITSLLLTERAADGRVSLGGFWRRRVRRLLPAIVVLLSVCASAAWLIGGDILTRIGWQILGALTFSYNWVAIGAGSEYFAASSPELFRNLWSLAVEEQFYVVWPLLLPLLLLVRPVWARAVVALAAAAASAVWMATLVGTDGSVTRAYFGTDSHAFGILVGVALAVVLQRPLRDPAPWMRRPAVRGIVSALGAAAVAGIVALATTAATDTVTTFPGMLLVAVALSSLAVVAGAWPGSWYGRAIDIAPLRWIGDRSYGLYLWHWPLLVLLTAAVTGAGPEAGVPLGIGLATLALTGVCAEVSYRLIETPVRRAGFRGTLAGWRRALTGTAQRRAAALGATCVAVLVLGGATAAIASAPEETSAEAVVQAGAEALRDQPTAEPSAPPEAEPAPAAPAPQVPTPQPTPVGGGEITAVGDSVMLASAPGLFDRFPGIQVDATVSRSMYAAPGILQQLADTGQLRKYVVIALGTNGPIERATLDRIAEICGPDRELILVTAYAPRDWIPGVNEQITAFADERADVELADWSRAIDAHTDYLAGDRIHPGTEGGRVFADTVGRAVDLIEAKRANAVYRQELREDVTLRGILSVIAV